MVTQFATGYRHWTKTVLNGQLCPEQNGFTMSAKDSTVTSSIRRPSRRPDGDRTEKDKALTIERRSIRIGHIVMGGRF